MAHGLPRARPSYETRRRAARRAGHIRLAVLVGAVVLIIVLSLVLSSGPPPKGHGASSLPTTSLPAVSSTTLPAPSSVPAVAGQLATWKLNSVLASSVVLAGAQAGTLIVAGGSEAGGSTAQGIYEVSTSNGAATQVGNLLSALYGAAAVVLGGKGYVLGGNDGSPVTTVQQLPSLGTGQASTATATQLGSLPAARAGAVAVVVGGTIYVVGGAGGSAGSAAVLATTDGTHFSTVATLPVPVTDAAATVVGDVIYVFGGDATTGTHAGQPVDAVQVVDPASHSASLAGSLPQAVAGAAAVTLGGVAYVAGGLTAASSGSSQAAVDTVLAWLPGAKRAVTAGHLAAPVADAGVTVIGSLAYLVGGESSAGTLVSTVQTFAQKPGTSVSS